MHDNLYKSHYRVPESAAEFSAINTGITTSMGFSSLEAMVGYVPANFNMLPWGLNWPSTDFTDPQWLITRASIVSGISDPIGGLTAQHIIENSGSGTHFVSSDNAPQTMAVTPINQRVAVIAQAAERNRIVVSWENFEDANAATSVGFDLTGGNVGYDTVVGSNATLVAYRMQNLGLGWWLCSFDVQYNATATTTSLVWQPKIYIDSGIGTAPRSISYTGNGTSGVNLWWFNILPVRTWSLTNLAFQDDFNSLSTIDLLNTQTAGFKWYVRNLAPNSGVTHFGWTTNPPSTPTLSSYLSIVSPSVLQIYNPNNNQLGYSSQIWSAVFPDAGGFIGSALGPPLVYDSLISWDMPVSPNWAGNPAFWGSTIDALIGTPSTGRFLEWDVVEAASGAGGSTNHEWSNLTANPPTDARAGAGSPFTSSMTLGTFVRCSGIWLPIDSSGWGTILPFANGQFIAFGDMAYSATSLPQPAGTNTVVGSFSEADSQLLPVFLNTAENVTANAGGGWKMWIDWVKVYKS